ncbi:MAG: DUF952 domain-containing protein [Pseudomonadota bacterium]
MQKPYLFHLVQTDLWAMAVERGETYYPPTYADDGFTHATANADLLLEVGNHFYTDIPGEWLCLRMTAASLADAGIRIVFERSAPVGDKQGDFSGSQDQLFPHLFGGIPPAAVIATHAVERNDTGAFLAIASVTDIGDD